MVRSLASLDRSGDGTLCLVRKDTLCFSVDVVVVAVFRWAMRLMRSVLREGAVMSVAGGVALSSTGGVRSGPLAIPSATSLTDE